MKPRVLFLCTGNSARSQMAEGYLRHFAADRLDVFSAGTRPAELNPLAVEAMRQIAIDISGQRSKDVKEFLGEEFDYVVTVCSNAQEDCPVFPGRAKRIHWNLNDPAAAQGSPRSRLEVFRRVRDEIVCLIESEFREWRKQKSS